MPSQIQLCNGALDDRSILQLILPPDDRGIAVLRQHCAAPDDSLGRTRSASLALRLGDRASTTIESVWGFHESYQLVWPRQGGALLFSTQARASDDGADPERRPEPGRYFSVDADTTVVTVDLGGDVSGVVHGPAAP